MNPLNPHHNNHLRLTTYLTVGGSGAFARAYGRCERQSNSLRFALTLFRVVSLLTSFRNLSCFNYMIPTLVQFYPYVRPFTLTFAFSSLGL
jgi:hypothetical protein